MLTASISESPPIKKDQSAKKFCLSDYRLKNGDFKINTNL